MIIGVDLGGTKVAAGLVEKGKILKHSMRLVEQQQGRAHIIEQILSAIDELGDTKAKIGIGVPGYYNGTKIAMLPNMIALNNVDLQKALKRKVVLGNDAKCFTLAEALYGAGKGKKIVVGLTLGTGVGSGLVINKKLYTGSQPPTSHRGEGGIPELGHLIVDYEADAFQEGMHEIDVEHFLSGRAIIARHTQRGGVETRASQIWSSSSIAAKATRAETSKWLAIFSANIVRMYGPDVIVVGGGVANATLLAETNALLPHYGCAPILRLAKLSDAGVLGAAMLVM